MSPEIYSSLFFLKAVSFSCCLQVLTPIKCNWMCRKSKGPAAVVSNLIYILQNWNIFYIMTDRLTSSNELVLLQQCHRAEAAVLESTRVSAVLKRIWVVEVRGQQNNWRGVGQAAHPISLLLQSSLNKSAPALSLWHLPLWWGAGSWLTEALLAHHVKNLGKCQEKQEWCSMFTFVICLRLSGVSREEQGVSVWGLDFSWENSLHRLYINVVYRHTEQSTGRHHHISDQCVSVFIFH